MKKLILSAAAMCLCALPAVAQTTYSTYDVSGGISASIVTAGDAVQLAIRGGSYATARWVVSTAGTATITTEYSTDGAVNWLASAYSKRLDAVSANPSVAPWANNSPVAGTFETPLPGNATHFRIRCGTGGTATVVSLSGGAFFVPGVPVAAVLWDVTSGTNAANNTGTLDVSGWASAEHTFTMNGGVPAFAIAEVDDAGVALANLVTGTAAFSGNIGSGTIGGTAGIVAATSTVQLPRRLQYTSAAIAAQTSRVRIVARR